MKIIDKIVSMFIDNDHGLHDSILASKETLRRLESLTEELSMRNVLNNVHTNIIESITDNIGIAVWAKDVDNKFVYANSVCCEKILHCTMEDAISFTDTDFENNTLAWSCNTSDGIVQENRQQMRFIEHNGDWWETFKSPWIVDGEMRGTIGTARDIGGVVPPYVSESTKEPEAIEIPLDMVISADTIAEIFVK